MPLQFSVEHLSTLIKFWILVLVVSGAGVWIFAPNRDSSAHSEAVVSGEAPLLFPPRIAEIQPKKNATDVLLGIEDPLLVRFTESVKLYHIRFELDPEAELLYENNPEKTEFRLLPRVPLREGTRYTLRISYISRETPDATYRPLTETSFTTLVVPVVTLPQSPELTALSHTAPYRTEGKYIDVDIAHQTMVLFEHGRAVDSYLVSSGKRGMDTPQGEFAVVNKALRPWSKAYGLYMPYWMAFTADGKFGIHELPEWPGGYKEGADHLGHPVSHGCIRLGVGNAKRVYEWADTGTVIFIH
ncbi:MAG: L,D-transpeptidase [Candidatus Moranbacteria bacterium]|nr:L,D-transpeptidase [Candidatus Moranbacteria bacterium]